MAKPAVKERTERYLMTVTTKDDPELRKFRERLKMLNRFVRTENANVDRLQQPSFGKLQLMSRMGKNNPNAGIYPKGKKPKSVHAGYFDVYVDNPIFTGYKEVKTREFVKYDDQTRVHCANGPAIEYAGFKIFFWHGTQVPREWIMRKGYLTPKRVFAELNQERRRAAIEIVGWAKLLKTLAHVVTDKDDDPEIGELLSVILPYARGGGQFRIQREQFLRVRCGTGREFAIPVPPTITTALDAQAWIWGAETSEQMRKFEKPEVRT